MCVVSVVWCVWYCLVFGVLIVVCMLHVVWCVDCVVLRLSVDCRLLICGVLVVDCRLIECWLVIVSC